MTSVASMLFLVYPNVGEQDLLVPWELLRSVAWSLGQQGRRLDVVLGSFDRGPVPTQMGTTIQPSRVVTEADRFDLVYVPGGIGAGAQSTNATLGRFLRTHHAEGRWVGANCAGVGVLHRAGVLDGAEVTGPATLTRRMADQGTRVVTPRLAWKIDPARRLFTAGGAGTVHPSTMALVWHLFGDDVARGLAAGWDALPLHGEALFALEGPAMRDEADVVRGLQDQWEGVFLPDAAGVVEG